MKILKTASRAILFSLVIGIFSMSIGESQVWAQSASDAQIDHALTVIKSIPLKEGKAGDHVGAITYWSGSAAMAIGTGLYLAGETGPMLLLRVGSVLFVAGAGAMVVGGILYFTHDLAQPHQANAFTRTEYFRTPSGLVEFSKLSVQEQKRYIAMDPKLASFVLELAQAIEGR